MGFVSAPAVFQAPPLKTRVSRRLSNEADMLSSLAISIREAAYRRDSRIIVPHIAELRLIGLALVKAYRALVEGGEA